MSTLGATCIERATTLFVEHEGLIPFTVGRFFSENPADIRAELAEEARVGLWKAALHYNPDKGTAFTTYAVTVIRRALLAWLIRTKGERGVIAASVSLSTPMSQEDDSLTLGDTLPSSDDVEAAVELGQLIQHACRSRAGRLAMAGNSPTEIAKKLRQPRRQVTEQLERLVIEAAGERPPKVTTRRRPRKRSPKLTDGQILDAVNRFVRHLDATTQGH